MDFLNWRTQLFISEDCPNYQRISIDPEFIPWDSEQQILTSFLTDLDSVEVDEIILKQRRTKEVYLKLRNELTPEDYEAIQTQLNTTNEPEITLTVRDCDGTGEPLKFKTSKPLFTNDLKTVFLIEKVFYSEENCWTKQVTSYRFNEGTWKEHINISRSNVCY